MSRYKMFRRDHHVTLPAKMVEIGFVRVINETGNPLLSPLIRSMQSDNAGQLSGALQRNTQIRVSPFVGGDGVADESPLVNAVNRDRFVHFEFQRRLGRLLVRV